jgi:hypothetical protein
MVILQWSQVRQIIGKRLNYQGRMMVMGYHHSLVFECVWSDEHDGYVTYKFDMPHDFEYVAC